MNKQEHALQISWEKIQLLCLKQGKSLQELASGTGLSRTTLNNWAKGKITKPHSQKINAIATALNVAVEEILTSPLQENARQTPIETIQLKVNDQQHNQRIAEVSAEQPALFNNWNTQDWDELYSEFGVGGGLTSQGVIHSATQINQKKEVFRKLEIILESDISDLAITMINSFYNKIQANPHQEL